MLLLVGGRCRVLEAVLPNLHPHDRILQDLELRVCLVPLCLRFLAALELQAGELE